MKLKEQIKQLRKLMENFDFQVGDKVKIVGAVEHSGDSGKVEDISPRGGFYLVNVGGKKGYYHVSNMKLLKREAQAQQFNKGAKVKTAEGLVGVITKTMTENNKVLHWVNNQGPFTEKELSRG